VTGRWWHRDTLVVTLSVCAVALTGGLLTEIGPWYLSLKQPSWKPPDWAFGPAWTVIFSFTGIAALTAWRQSGDAASRRMIAATCLLSALMNVLWSVLFFKLRRPDWSLVQIFALLASILMMMLAFRRSSVKATLLLTPYFVWVCFAATINYGVTQLNKPFGS
jgi:translocator protein